MAKSTIQRFEEKIELIPFSTCHWWTGAINPAGYGQLRIKGKTILATHFSYKLYVGEISNLCVLHKCDNPACVNPDHLFLGTQQDNVADMMSKNRGQKGSRNGMAKLCEKDVLDIRNLFGTMSFRKIAKKYGIVHASVSNIFHRKRWSHII